MKVKVDLENENVNIHKNNFKNNFLLYIINIIKKIKDDNDSLINNKKFFNKLNTLNKEQKKQIVKSLTEQNLIINKYIS